MIFRSKKQLHPFKKTRSFSRRSPKKDDGLLKKTLYKSSLLLFSLIFLGAIFSTGYLYYINSTLPDVDRLNTYIPYETTKIYANDKKTILAELHREENRVQIPLEKISPILKKTVIALEDTDFYKHRGVNLKGFARAVVKNIQAGRFKEGASTLTQQLARNVFLSKEKKIKRKVQDMLLAIKIEKKFTKQEILEMYLNEVYWGHNSYGIESASQLYFGKNAKDLSLGESAALAGMLKGPEIYSPFKSMSRCKERQAVVLMRMAKLKLISNDELINATNEPLVLATRKKHRYKAPFFTSFVVKQLIEEYGEEATYTSGMKVYTTLDYGLQKHAEKVVNDHLALGEKSYWIKDKKVPNLNYSEAALMAVDPRTGYIKVLQGGKDFKNNEFDRCLQAKRQPGSSFKPFVYLTALEKGYSPGYIIDDAPVTYNTIEGPYSPLNYSLKFRGKIPLSKALEKSVNVVAIKLNNLIGPENVVKNAQKMGITSPLKPVLSLPLGANEVSMLELVQAYSVIANRGIKVKPVGILQIEDRNGIVLYKHKLKEEKIFDKNLMAALIEMMKNVVNYGTGRGAKIPRPMAGKTGTTSDYKDAWFVGFVPQLVCATWVGNDNNDPMNNVTGGWIPARMWKSFMNEALKNIKAQSFPKAKGLVSAEVNWDTGRLVSEDTPEDAKKSILKYWQGKLPKEKDTQEYLKSLALKKRQAIQENENLQDFFDIQ